MANSQSIEQKLKILRQLEALDKLDKIDKYGIAQVIRCIKPKPVNCNNSLKSKPVKPIKLNVKQTKAGKKSKSKSVYTPTLNQKTNLRDAANPMENVSDHSFQVNYGFRKDTVLAILQMIDYGMCTDTQRGSPKSPLHALLITLKFLISGNIPHQSSLCEAVSQSTISRILKKVTGLLSELRLRFIKIPEGKQFKSIEMKFKENGGLPEVFGCIGSTHIAIKTPNKTLADDYLNEYGYHSNRFLAISGPNLEFYEIISRWPGASHENKIFNLTEVFQRFEYTNKMEGVLLANERYVCTNFVLTPIEDAVEINDIRYNEAHRATYNFPKTIQLLKQRFKCLQTVLCHSEGKIFISESQLNLCKAYFYISFFFNSRNNSDDYYWLCCIT